MTAWAAGSKPRERQRVTPPAFVLASDLLPYQSDWNRALAQAESLVERAAPVLGFAPRVRLASMAMHPGEDAGEHGLDRVLDNEAAGGAREIFVLPASLDWNLWQREAFGRTLAEFRRCYGNTAVFHDDVDPCHPLVVECFADIFARALAGHQVPPHRLGLLLVASGHGDSGSRSQSYRLMRLLWERLSLARADVAFLRHAQEFLDTAIERAAREPLDWVLVPQIQWHTPAHQRNRSGTHPPRRNRFQPGRRASVQQGWCSAGPPLQGRGGTRCPQGTRHGRFVPPHNSHRSYQEPG